LGGLEEFAAALEFLTSDYADYRSGPVIRVNEGDITPVFSRLWLRTSG
jgi:hypothetical protein